MVLFHYSDYRCFKHFYITNVCKYLKNDFPDLLFDLIAYSIYPTKPNINIDNLQRIGLLLSRIHVIYFLKMQFIK